MKKFFTLTLAALILTSSYMFGQADTKQQKDADRSVKADSRVDNNGYWRKMAALGLATLNPVTPVKTAKYVGSEIRAFSVITEDSPDVAVAGGNSTQSENSVFVDPNNNQNVVNSNNSTPNPVSGIYGSNSIESFDGGLTWDGSVQGAGGSNSGDPVALIGLDGTYYIGAISNPGGQLIAKSTDQGATYQTFIVSPNPGDLADKNHMWIDNSPTSPYSNNIYNAWTDFGGPYDAEIALSYSSNGGVTWTPRKSISSAINAGSHNQGVNLSTGPDGEAYAVWAVYDNWPNPENTIGFARSFDGGATYEPATRIISNIRGIRNTSVMNVKNMRNNSFPVMTVDISNSEYRGNLYVVWTNIGVPGVNTGSDVDVYMSRSEDQGTTWSTPVRVNQDPSGLGNIHYFPWITCDPENGILSVVFYDDRDVSNSQCEAYCANSSDGGETWEDFKVSDVAFTPSPIPGLASGYMGDYLGINARGGWVYPTWADNRTGTVMTYCSPYQTNPLAKPKNLIADVPFETGLTSLQWGFDEMEEFSYFKIYRDNDSIGITSDTVYADQLPDYGIYTYEVTAKYDDGNESGSSNASVQWGDPHISVTPGEIEVTLMPDSSAMRYVTVSNVGQLDMSYNISMFIPTNREIDDTRAYCTASGGACDEYIARFTLNEIDNISSCSGYANYTTLSTIVTVGNTYTATVYNGAFDWPSDQCGMWIDWNQNEEFDENEEIPMSGTPGIGPYIAQITPPIGAKSGPTRLRTRIAYNETPQACGNTSYGEVEDYTVNVISWLEADPISGTVAAGENLEIAVALSAVEMELGDYDATMTIFSDDPDDPQIIVPITMHVAEFAVNLNVDDESICLGESVQISSATIGGSGTFAYSWTSEPPGFTSADPAITVTPEVTTTYFIEVLDELLMVSGQVTIQVNPLPVVSVGADTMICVGDTVTLMAGEGFASYLWSTGDISSSIKVAATGDYSVTVANEFDCTSMDMMSLTVLDIPEKAVIATGPATVDNYVSTVSQYTCNEATHATSYQWTISLVEAGTISGTGNNAEISWAAGFTGDVTITAAAMNTCFTGEVSNAYTTTVYSSAGLDENAAGSQLVIYPNPTDGKITLKLPSQLDFTGDLMVTDANGAVIFNKSGLTISAGESFNMDLTEMADGIYTVKLSSNTTVFFGRIVIK